MLKVVMASMVLLAGVSHSNAETAMEMHDYCRGISDAQLVATQQIVVPTTFEAGACWGAFSALQTLTVVKIGDGPHLALRTCLPPKSTRLQLVRVFRQYVTDHPEIGHEDWAIVALTALWEAFPCD